MTFNKILLTLMLSAFALPAVAKAHTVTISFTKSTDDAGAVNSGYTTYRLTGSCPASVTSTTGAIQLNSTLFTGTSYVDNTPTVGTWCYFLTFTAAAASSNPSNTAGAVVIPASPTNVVVTGAN